MSVHKIEVPVEAGAAEVIGLLGHRRPGWLRPFLLLARRSVGDGAAGDVDFELGEVIYAEDGCRAAALQWSPEVGVEVFTTFSGRLVVCEHAGHVVLAVEGDARGGVDQVNAGLLTRLAELLAGALAEADTVGP